MRGNGIARKTMTGDSGKKEYTRLGFVSRTIPSRGDNMNLPKGKKISELYFQPELVESRVNLELCRENIHVHLAEKDDKVGNITMPDSSVQRTRFGRVTAVGPDVDQDYVKPGDIVAIQFHVGSHLNAPAFGFRDKSHVICTANNIMFFLRDKEE